MDTFQVCLTTEATETSICYSQLILQFKHRDHRATPHNPYFLFVFQVGTWNLTTPNALTHLRTNAPTIEAIDKTYILINYKKENERKESCKISHGRVGWALRPLCIH